MKHISEATFDNSFLIVIYIINSIAIVSCEVSFVTSQRQDITSIVSNFVFDISKSVIMRHVMLEVTQRYWFVVSITEVLSHYRKIKCKMNLMRFLPGARQLIRRL
jgi:hypothetical protein